VPGQEVEGTKGAREKYTRRKDPSRSLEALTPKFYALDHDTQSYEGNMIKG